jgi:hypothetical protein
MTAYFNVPSLQHYDQKDFSKHNGDLCSANQSSIFDPSIEEQLRVNIYLAISFSECALIIMYKRDLFPYLTSLINSSLTAGYLPFRLQESESCTPSEKTYTRSLRCQQLQTSIPSFFSLQNS